MDPILMQQLMVQQGGDSASSDIYEPTISIERDEENLDQELPVNNNEESFEVSLVSLIRSMHERMTQIGEALPIIESRMTQIEETLPQMYSEMRRLAGELQDIKNEQIIQKTYEKNNKSGEPYQPKKAKPFFGLFGGSKRRNRPKKTLSWKYSN